MKPGAENNTKALWIYLGKITITAFLFYSTADLAQTLGFVKIFSHEEYTIFWPPSGVALGLMLTWGRSIWPGILIGSLFRIPNAPWFQLYNSDIFINTAFTASIFSLGRIFEPIIGQYLLRKFNAANQPFKSTRNIVYFIITASLIGFISSAAGAIGIHSVRNDSIYVLFLQTAGWYIDNVIGILIFTPLTYAILSEAKQKIYSYAYSLVSMTLLTTGVFLTIYYLKDSSHSFHVILENALPFLLIPLLLWIAFSFNLMIVSYMVFTVSILFIYFTYLGHGPFITDPNNFQYTVWLLQCFLFLISVATLVSYAVSLELKENMIQRTTQNVELQYSQQILLQTMEDLQNARNKVKESDRLKSSFLANMSHEIRTPMNAIMGISELLDREEIPEEKRKELTYLINEQSENLLTIINNILLISQLEINQKRPILIRTDLYTLFEELKENYSEKAKQQKGKSIALQHIIDLPEEDHLVVADAANLKIVLANLLDNALKFTQQGHIEFSCTKQDQHTLLFTVSDTGIGIPAEKFKLIFRPFSHADEATHLKHGGTGLGLAICKILVSNWGGDIWLESTKGKGSMFSFTMPYQKGSPAREE